MVGKNVLFVTSAAPRKSPFSTVEKTPPLGVGSLMAVARRAGHQVFFIDNYLQPTPFIEEGFLQEHAIDFVGIYSNTVCYNDMLRMFGALQQLRESGAWHGAIAVGGPHTAVGLDGIPGYVDHVVIGPGEGVILNLIEEKIKERVLRGPRVEDLDALPFQPWDLFTRLGYDFSCSWLDARPVFTLNTSRGCPMKCAFCSVRSIWGDDYTTFSAKRIVAEIRHLVTEYGAKGIYFREDNFTLDKRRVRAFCERLSAEGLHLEWACESAVPSLCDAEFVRLLAKSGCRAVYLGVESGSQRMLDRMNKKITVAQIEKCARLCAQHGIRAYFSLLAGLPGETVLDFLKTVRMLVKLKPYHFAFNVFVAIPGSPLYEEILSKHLYEFQDDLGLLYLPGYDVKARLFYDQDSHELVDHDFGKPMRYDRMLRWMIRLRQLKRALIPKKNAR